MNLGENIYKLRTAKNLSQAALADLLGVSRQSVSKWETDTAIPDLDKLMKMSELFGISLDELVGSMPMSSPEPAAVQTPQCKSMPGHKLAGIILLCCGFVAFIAFTIMGYFMDQKPLGLVLALPFVWNGIICLLCKKHTGFICCWANYLLIWLFFTVFLTQAPIGYSINTPAGLFALASTVILVVLVIWSLYKLRKGHFSIGPTATKVWCVALVLLLVLQLFLLLGPSFSQADDSDDGAIETEWVYLE